MLKPPKGTLQNVHFPLVSLVCSKTFLCCSGFALVRNFRNFSAQQSPLSCVFHRDCADPLYITGVMVHKFRRTFRMLGYAIGPSFLAIFPSFWSDLKNNFTILNSLNFLRRIGWMERIFITPNFSALGFPHLGLLTSVGLRPKRHPFGVYDMHLYYTGLHENYSSRLCAG